MATCPASKFVSPCRRVYGKSRTIRYIQAEISGKSIREACTLLEIPNESKIRDVAISAANDSTQTHSPTTHVINIIISVVLYSFLSHSFELIRMLVYNGKY